MVETGFAYLRNMLTKVEMADDPILLLLSANNNKVCFIWVKL